MPADIEAAGQVVQCHGTYACHEDTLEHALELLEHIAVEAAGMGDGMVNLLAFLVKHDVGKVVVFVNDEIKRNAQPYCTVAYQVQFVGHLPGLEERFHCFLRIVIPISVHEVVQHQTAIIIKTSRKLFNVSSHP